MNSDAIGGRRVRARTAAERDAMQLLEMRAHAVQPSLGLIEGLATSAHLAVQTRHSGGGAPIILGRSRNDTTLVNLPAGQLQRETHDGVQATPHGRL